MYCWGMIRRHMSLRIWDIKKNCVLSVTITDYHSETVSKLEGETEDILGVRNYPISHKKRTCIGTKLS